MTTYTSLRDAIQAVVVAAAPTAQVQACTRYVSEWADYLSLFKDSSGLVHGWWLSLANPAITAEPFAFGDRRRLYHFLITGILAEQDSAATEVTQFTEAEAILDGLDAATTFGVTGVTVRDFDAQLRTVQLRTFGSVLCNYAEITIDVPVAKAF